MTTELVQKQDSPPVVQAETALIDRVIQAASDPSVDVDKFERMMAMAERLQAKKAEAEFNKAMTAAQKRMGRVAANADNRQTRSRYATYDALDRELRPIYTGEGFSLSFDTGEAPAPLYVRVQCYVSHVDGHSRTYHVDIPADGKGAKGGDVMTLTHAAGSAMSYGSRYLLKLIFNVAVGEDDDDGNTATGQRITEEQLANIECLITEIGVDRGAVLKWAGTTLKVDRFEDLNPAGYKQTLEALEAKRKSAAK